MSLQTEPFVRATKIKSKSSFLLQSYWFVNHFYSIGLFSSVKLEKHDKPVCCLDSLESCLESDDEINIMVYRVESLSSVQRQVKNVFSLH